MELLKPFNQLTKNDANIAGGKGASLGEMTNAKIPVPQGFVILSDSFEKFLEETDLNIEIDSILHKVDHQKIHTVEEASEKIEALILNAEMPKDIASEIKDAFIKMDSKYVAVRSSATAEDSASAAWAGQLESYLNTTEESLLENVKRCWASLFTPRAIFYRFEKDLHKTKISVAVVVQKMVESEMSGIAFSVHPVTQDRNQLIIEAGLGLGEAIVSGQITPDSYVVEKEPRRIIDTNVVTQTRGLYRKENGGNEWCDISKEKGEKQVLSDEQILELSEIILQIEKHYGFPCDIEWAFEGGKFYIVQSRPITTLNNFSSDNKENLPIDPNCEIFRWGPVSFKYFYGADYLSALSTPLDYVNSYWPKGITLFHKNEMVWIHDFADFRKIGTEIFKDVVLTGKYEDHIKKYQRNLLRMHEQERKIKEENITIFSNQDFITLLKETNQIIVDFWLPTLAAEIGNYGSVDLLREELEKTVDHNVCDEIIRIMTTSEGMSFYQEEEIALQESDDLRKHQQDYFWLHNSYAGNEYLTIDFFKERKDKLKQNLRDDYKRRIEKIKEDKKSIVTKYKLSKKNIDIANKITDAMKWQDERKKEVWILQSYKQILLDETKQRTKKKYLERFGLLELADILSGKEKEREESFGFVMDNGSLKELDKKTTEEYWEIYTKEHVTDTDNIKGIIANSGKISGIVKMVRDPKDKDLSFPEKFILVAPMTSPDYIFLMKKSLAIITDTGGLTSHAAIVSRELGKPCIIGTKIATQVLKDGDLVEVDADNGIVRILEKK